MVVFSDSPNGIGRIRPLITDEYRPSDRWVLYRLKISPFRRQSRRSATFSASLEIATVAFYVRKDKKDRRDESDRKDDNW